MDPSECFMICRSSVTGHVCTRRIDRDRRLWLVVADLRAENATLRAEISKEIDNKTAALDSITARAIQMVEELEAELAAARS